MCPAGWLSRLAPAVFALAPLASPAIVEEAAPSLTPPALSPGQRVRVTHGRSETFVADVLESDDKTVLLRRRDVRDPIRLWFTELESLEIANGRRRRGKEGALAGLSAAGVVAVWDQQTPGDQFGRMALAASVGSVVGYFLGELFQTERWEPLRVRSATVRMGAPPTGLGAVLQVTF